MSVILGTNFAIKLLINTENNCLIEDIITNLDLSTQLQNNFSQTSRESYNLALGSQ